MVRRLLDVVGAAIGLVLAAPLVALAAVGIKLSSPGPVMYRTRRVGANGVPFQIYKLRTMHERASGDRITAPGDDRIFAFGRFLRRAKIDELPQLVNVLRGEMALVGPRPEEPEFVERHYADLHLETLAVRPGLTSPGALWQYTCGDAILAAGDTVERYLAELLPAKLAIDLAYVRRASLSGDLRVMCRTMATIAAVLAGKRSFAEPDDLARARDLIVPARGTASPEAAA